MQLKSLPWSRLATSAIVLIAVAFAVTHVAAVFTERINWDEFLLFQRAEVAVKLDRLEGGGRPGLGVIALLPFVSDCVDPVGTINAARIAWALVTFALLAGLFTLLRQAASGSFHAAALGTACIALVPVFMRWSLQVRTDQPAIACALWGSVALFASHRRHRLALVGGTLIGVGYLFSQKAVYVAGLGGLLTLGKLFIDSDAKLRREAERLAWLVAGGIAAVLTYKLVIPLCFEASSTMSIERGMNTFAYYRKYLGYRVYENMLPLLYSHLLLVIVLIIAFVRAYSRDERHRRALLIALATLTAGIVVGWFHAAAFPYFWMTLGLFPSAAFAIGWPSVTAMLGRAATVIAVIVWAGLVYRAAPFARELLSETQAPQRDSFAFIARNLPTTAVGFHADGGLFCRDDPNPMPVFVRETIKAKFFGPRGAENAVSFIEEFRRRPVSFVLTPRLETFPPVVRTFWDRHYVLYRAAVRIAGFRVSERSTTVDVLVPGTYRWLGESGVEIGEQTINPGATIGLAAGPATLRNPTGRAGTLVLAVEDPPQPTRGEFHSITHAGEIVGLRRW